ncbi:MAG: hypothetical protein EXX96DRAFT_550706 [Benjaminiella poitrasii]|nr:MAG: hypothetical protein EXX96DRAFT_550706 [Benjaminiella poitrasii]
MVSFIGFLIIYVIGGITFLPLIAVVTVLYIKGSIKPLPPKQKREPEPVNDEKDSNNVIIKKGWIRLINQYQPKMPEVHSGHTSNNGGGIISGIQSYVSGGNNNNYGSNSNSNSNSNKNKKGVFYAVLKHDSLFCYESERQQEVVMTLPMRDYHISLYPPNSETKPEGEIYGRRAVISLTPINLQQSSDVSDNSKLDPSTVCILPEEDITYNPTRKLYLTCARNIDKEDWYFGLIEANHIMQEDSSAYAPENSPQYVMMDNTHFDASALEDLIRQVQSSSSHQETAWINAILGRIFLGMYKTDRLKNLVEMKIRKKIDKTKRPSFLDEIHVRDVDVGQSVPFITNPRLLSLTPEGEVIVEAKVEYKGGLTIEIETDFNWSYSSRMKPIRMNLVLAVTLKRLSGRMMFKLKAPPTNRFWLSFFEMPEMEWKITPVVADKTIKLGIITNAIESRIREVMAETFVLPNMEDTAFCASGGKGGIFGKYVKVEAKNRRTQADFAADAIRNNTNNGIGHRRTSSTPSVASSLSSKRQSASGMSEPIRETPTVPASTQRRPISASDTLKLKERRAESSSELVSNTSTHDNNKVSVEPSSTASHKLEVTHSLPEMQMVSTTSVDDSSSLKSLDRISLTESTATVAGSSSTSTASNGSKWTKGTFLRKRTKKVENDNDEDDDTESINQQHTTTGKSFLNKISNFLPTEKENSQDDQSLHSVSTTSTNNSANSKRNSFRNMAESFISKRLNLHDEEEEDFSKPTRTEKKELYAERIANMRKRAEERRLSSSSASTNSSVLPPPLLPTVIHNHTINTKTEDDNDKEPVSEIERQQQAFSLPPIKPQRNRSASASQNSIASTSSNHSSSSPIQQFLNPQPPLPPRSSTSSPAPYDPSATVLASSIPTTATANVIAEVSALVVEKDSVPVLVSSNVTRVEDTVQHSQPPALPDKPRPAIPHSIIDSSNNVQTPSLSPPPLPTTPRPITLKRATLEKENEPVLSLPSYDEIRSDKEDSLGKANLSSSISLSSETPHVENNNEKDEHITVAPAIPPRHN